MITFNIIGAGRLGKAIAFALLGHELAALKGICNQSMASAKMAVSDLGRGQAFAEVTDLPPADLTVITSPDEKILSLATTLAKNNQLSRGSTVIHCSGILASQLLHPLQAKGLHIASFHPLRAFRSGGQSLDAFSNCDCVLEGDQDALSLLTTLFEPLGARFAEISPEKKASYHAGAVIASNYLVSLAAIAKELFVAAGMREDEAGDKIIRLMQSSLTNLQNAPSFAAALTGPLARGDTETIAQHLVALDDPVTKSLYQAAGLATLPLTHLAVKDKERILQLLGN